jgi:hypothetical protein
MDYISSKIEEKLNLAKASENEKDVNQIENIYIQYHLFLLFGILFNSNKLKIALQDKNKLLRPSLGTIVELTRKWNSDTNLIENWQNFENIFSIYVNTRNNSGFGHGYDFSHDNQHINDKFKQNILDLKKTNFYSQSYNIVQIEKIDNKYVKGKSYNNSGKIVPWQIVKENYNFEIGDLYYQKTNFLKDLFGINSIYLKISPFIYISNDNFYTFQGIAESITGTIKYNNIFNTEQIAKDFLSFERFGMIDSDISHNKIKSVKNGMIKNDFTPNYEKFIKSSSGNIIRSEVHKFLGNNSTCTATIWGHGGVGKTASIQEICDDLFFNYSKEKLLKNNLYFDYIIFLSAKDRKYDYSSGRIEEINEDRLTDFNDFITKLNEFVFNESECNIERFYKDFNRRILIIVDDFETLSNVERERILSFTENLDVKHYKLIISSRLATNVGKEIEKRELNDEESISFLADIIENEFNADLDRFNFNEPEIIHGIHKITEGRPLFIFHFAHILMQLQEINDAIKIDIKNSMSAIDFLYGRIYSYLDNHTQTMYKVLGVIVSKNDLLYRVNNLKYILEFDDSVFDRCINSLWKLRIISLSDNRDFISVYSPEILENMIEKIKEDEELHKRIDLKLKSDSFILFGSSKSIYDQKLEQAKTLSKTERKLEKVVDAFESIISDKRFNRTEQLVAFKELIQYLLHRNIDYQYALNLCNDYSIDFKNEMKFNIIYFNTLYKAGYVQKAIALASPVIKNLIRNENISNDYFELAGQYLKIYSTLLREQKDDLIDSQSEYSKEDFDTMSYNIKKDMIDFIKEIEKVFIEISCVSFSHLNKRQSTSIGEGFYSCAQLIRRTLKDKNTLNQGRLDLFESMCDFGIKHCNSHLRDNFYNLKFRVETNEKEEHDKKKPKQTKPIQSEFAVKLAEALKNKNEQNE